VGSVGARVWDVGCGRPAAAAGVGKCALCVALRWRAARACCAAASASHDARLESSRGEPRRIIISSSSTSSSTSSTRVAERRAPAALTQPAISLPCAVEARRPLRASEQSPRWCLHLSHPACTAVQYEAPAEALADPRAAPRTPRRGRSDERSVRRPRAASPAVSRESGAAACAQQPPRQRRAAATAAQPITAIGGFTHASHRHPKKTRIIHRLNE